MTPFIYGVFYMNSCGPNRVRFNRDYLKTQTHPSLRLYPKGRGNAKTKYAAPTAPRILNFKLKANSSKL
jgi:hypothetical protein